MSPAAVDGLLTATALLWAADCVEHFARRADAVDGNVVETLALARAYALERDYQTEAAQRLATEAETTPHSSISG